MLFPQRFQFSWLREFFSFDESGCFQHGKQLPPNPVYEKVTGLATFMSLEKTTFLQKWKDFFKKKRICWPKLVTFVFVLFPLQCAMPGW